MATKRARTAWDSAESARREQNHSNILKNVGISSTGGARFDNGVGHADDQKRDSEAGGPHQAA